jgi:hypothetical protein
MFEAEHGPEGTSEVMGEAGQEDQPDGKRN